MHDCRVAVHPTAVIVYNLLNSNLHDISQIAYAGGVEQCKLDHTVDVYIHVMLSSYCDVEEVDKVWGP